jgi:ATP-dependent RNA helicase DeaD
MQSFKEGITKILVCTDVAARGIDIKDLSGIINFDLPQEDEVYVHRIGRTGRAGANGLSISIATQSERKKVSFIESYTKSKMNLCEIPSKEDIYKRIDNRFVDKVIEEISNNQNNNDLILEKLAHLDCDPMKVMNALINLAHQSRKEYQPIQTVKAKKEYEKKEKVSKNARGGRPYIMAEINLGKNQGIRPQILLSYIGKVAGVRKENVGDIILKPNYTMLEITKTAYVFLQRLNGKTYEGVKIKVKKS